MLNFVLIRKILESAEEDPKMIETVLSRVAIVSEEIFQKKFTSYVVLKMDGEAEMESFVSLVEGAEAEDGDQFEKYSKWLEDHKEVDFDEFLQEYDEEMQKMQIDIIKGIKDSLNDQQKREMVDFVQKQKEEIKEAEEEYTRDLRKIYDELKARASQNTEPKSN